MKTKPFGGLAFSDHIQRGFARMRFLFACAADIIFPDNLYCACCGDTIDPKTRIHSLCDRCIEKITWISDNPYASSMSDFSFDELVSCCIYGALPGKIIHDLKLNGKRYLAKPVAKLMTERITAEYGNADLSEDFDAVCYIPAAKARKQSRGFNQAELLSEYIAAELGIPLFHALVKTKETVSLRLSSAEERRTALRGVFDTPEIIKVCHYFNYSINGKTICVNKRSRMERSGLAGCSILLIDDVFTTGSTVNEAALTLKNAGTSHVTALVFSCGTGNRKRG